MVHLNKGHLKIISLVLLFVLKIKDQVLFVHDFILCVSWGRWIHTAVDSSSGGFILNTVARQLAINEYSVIIQFYILAM